MGLTPHAGHFFGRVCLCLTVPGSLTGPQRQMTADEACKRLGQVGEYLRSDQAAVLDAVLVPAPLHLFGGEPFSRIDDLERVLCCAQHNLLSAEISTGVSWVESSEQVRTVLERFAGKLHGIEITVSGSPLDSKSIDRIESLVAECRRASLFVSVRCSVGPGSPFPKELLALEALNRRASFIQSTPNTALILAAEPAEARSAWLVDSPPRRRCAELFNFVIVEGGDCYPCLEGVGLSALCLGSLERESALAILQRALADRHFQSLRNLGPHRLFTYLRSSQASDRLEPGYVDACHFHRHILSNPALASEAAQCNLDPAPTAIATQILHRSIR